MRIISISNQKGGCGKTTTALNLAAALSTNAKKVLIIDLDPQAHATSGLNIKAEYTIYNVLSKMTNRRARIQDIIQNIGERLDIAPSGIILSTLEQELAGEIGRESRLWETLNNFKSDYDYVLIDCPPNLGILTINAIRASTEIIIPVEASRFSLEGVDQLTGIINLVRDRLSHKADFRVLVANFDSRLRHSFQMLERIKTNFKGKLFSTIVHVNVKLKEAQNNGTHIFSFDKYCRGAKDYYSLSREIIMQEHPAVVAAPQERKEKRHAQLEKKMNEIMKEELPRINEVIFSFASKEAKEVFLVGDFNNWKLDDGYRMQQVDGRWEKKLALSGGRYHYRFVVDGSWTEDPANPKKETNPYGSVDSLIDVAVTEA